ncbi:MAG: mobile mystery protein B [Candidatus Babeliaceae bacterium]|nr:mobile mystery protein B [Candidatus Babeliaceae bacterium]
MKFNYPPGSTPLETGELAGLLPKHITTQEELNAWEEKNIIEAEPWAFKQKDILSTLFIKKLHKRMFDKTWEWAGEFRTSEKNIGAYWAQVPMLLQVLCDDVRYQLERDAYSNDEIAVRFHHRLVSIHPFSNGNGRHARLMADVLIVQQGGSRFTWGMYQDLTKTTSVRKQYIQALQVADKGDYSKLLLFARS